MRYVLLIALLGPLGGLLLFLMSSLPGALATLSTVFLLLAFTQYRNHQRGYVHDGQAVSETDRLRAIERYVEEVRKRRE